MPSMPLIVPLAPLPAHPKVRIRTHTGVELTLPLGPRGGKLGGWTRNWQETERPARKSVMGDTGPSLATASYTVTIIRADGSTIDAILKQLKAIAGLENGLITIIGLSTLEAGPWRMTAGDPEILDREHGTNAITRARVDLTFTEAVTPELRIGRSGRVVR